MKASLQPIITNPYLGKALKNKLADLRSFRTSRFRIICRISGQKLIKIVAIGSRKCTYEDTFRLLKGKEGIC
ncbi:MAG: type II toxin-antitoxin system RelE/ParE family toxin [Candidatus Brocadia sinica]|nr:type II toxin-antitoxin system RelE/ParE family toxin [Candidatus Brocadia sinica]